MGLKVGFKELRLESKFLNRGLRRDTLSKLSLEKNRKDKTCIRLILSTQTPRGPGDKFRLKFNEYHGGFVKIEHTGCPKKTWEFSDELDIGFVMN